MENKLNETYFMETTQKMLKNKSVYGAVFCVENSDKSISFIEGIGDIKSDDRYFIASVTKLYVTAVMIMLREEGKLDFSDRMHTYFPEGLIDKIHVLNGKDNTKDITIAHLLSNTSGIPDYFYYDKPKGEAASMLLTGKDQAWPLDKAVMNAKKLKPKFMPGQKGKVNYSDTNFQLLGGIIEKVTGRQIGEVFDEYIFKPLGLKDTYAYKDLADTTPVPMYYKTQKIHAPNYMASVTAEGGIVSTAKESMAFVKAFFEGFFFPKEMIEELKTNWNMIYFPGQFFFGLGLEKLWTPRIFTPVKPIGEVLGFWGQSGAFAWYNPKTGLFFTGTINQASGFGHSAAYRAIIRIIKAIN